MIEVIITKKPWSKPRREKRWRCTIRKRMSISTGRRFSFERARKREIKKTQKKKTKIDTTREEKIITRKEYNTKKNQLWSVFVEERICSRRFIETANFQRRRGWAERERQIITHKRTPTVTRSKKDVLNTVEHMVNE